ncbi:MAG TPA: apolipoprotein N-acyltransferase [Xanthobacteraceae bacterium]
MLARLADPIVLAWGWRRALIASLAGAASTLALEPFSLWPVMLVTFPVLAWLIDGIAARGWTGLRAAAAIGWCFGFGYCLAGLYWLGYALLVDAKTFGWMLPFAVIGVPAGLAIFTAFGVALARALWTPGATRILTLAAALTASEWLRGNVLTGFPWNAFGYALTGPLVLAQSAALVGLWGLTFVAVAVFSSPAALADDKKSPGIWLAPGVAAIVLIAMWVYGAARLAATPTTLVEGVRLRIMQPNLQQDTKFNYAAKPEVLRRYFELSARASSPRSSALGDATHLIWPESPFPFFLAREPDVLAAIADLLPTGTVLITGAMRAEESGSKGEITRAYNSIYVIDDGGAIVQVYDKVHLVPFGEYLPMRDVLERWGLMPLTKVPGGFSAGDRHRTLPIPRAPPFLPLVCYEIVFPGAAIPRGIDRPSWIANLTNDGWFGISTGPYQHFQQARVRAIEEGLSLARAANTGISAIVDPLGRIIASLPLGVEGVLDSGLPAAVEPPLSTRLGDRHIVLVLAAIFALAMFRRSRWR